MNVLTATNVITLTIRRWKCTNQINSTEWKTTLNITMILTSNHHHHSNNNRKERKERLTGMKMVQSILENGEEK